MFEYVRYARCGKSIRQFCPEGGLRRVLLRDKKGRVIKQIFQSRVRHGKTERDHANGNPQRNFARKRARDEWRNETRSAVYADPMLVPAFPG